MPNAIRPKRSNTAAAVPSASALTEGEIAINYADKKIYGKDFGGSVKLFTPGLATASAAGSIIVGSGLGVSSGTVSSNVRSVAGRGGSVVIVPGDVSGLSSVAASGSAADLTGTLADARLTGNQLTISAFQSSNEIDPQVVENFPASLAFSVTAHSAGNLLINFFTPLVTKTVSQITMHTSSVAAAGVTAARFGLYTYDEANLTIALVAAIANDNTLFTATNTIYTRSFSTGGGLPASYTLQAGARYGIGSTMLATTYPTLASRGVNAAVSIGALFPKVAGQVVGSTGTLPTGGVNNVAITTNQLYARFS